MAELGDRSCPDVPSCRHFSEWPLNPNLWSCGGCGKYLLLSVAVFCIHKDSGLLEEICNLKISGSYPKTLSFLPDCEHFIVLNQESNEIVTFSIKKGANYFLMEGKPLEIQTPNCIQFYDLDA